MQMRSGTYSARNRDYLVLNPEMCVECEYTARCLYSRGVSWQYHGFQYATVVHPPLAGSTHNPLCPTIVAASIILQGVGGTGHA